MGSPSVLQVGEARNLRGERFSAFKVVIYSLSKATLGSQEVGRGQPVRLQVGGATCVGLGTCEANVLRLSLGTQEVGRGQPVRPSGGWG